VGLECPACRRENPEENAFCGGCGARLARVCPGCQRENPPDQSFCGGCGHPLIPPADVRKEREPRDYTPKYLADKILQSKSALEGERKQVTVLFADVMGSMELAEQLDPEEWHRLLERFFEILAEGVHRFEGTVNQYTGDGIMALFGAPIAHEDHAQRACYAALWLKDALQTCAREAKREHGVRLATRIGLHSGEVVVGKIGDDLRMDYTAQGHTVGLAQRMESLAEPNTAYLSGDTAKLVAGFFDLEDLGAFQVKGASEPAEVFHLRGAGPFESRFQQARARGLSRFVGREADMEALEAALAQARQGNGQVVGIVADAGTGKSRLCFEFLERCRAQGIQVTEGHAVSHGRNIPLLPMLQIFRAYFGITERDDECAAREKIAGRLLLLDPDFDAFLPVLFEFFGVPDPDRSAARIEPDVKQQQIFEVIRKVVQAADPEMGQGVALIEDLHWLDAASEVFLEQWVDAVAGSHFLLLVNFRPEYGARWTSRSYYRPIPLAPLGPEAVRELLRDLLGPDRSVAGLAEAIHERTGGNPFFTEEVVRSLIESGQLEGADGAYRLLTPVERLEVPSTVQALLSARIDRLPEQEKGVLQTAAVIGKEFPAPVLVAASESSQDEVESSLRALVRAEFAYEQSLYPVLEYAFKHPLTQEVALGSQLRDRRRRTHAAVAKALEVANASHLEETAALLAHHWEEAGERRAAARWHRRAAEWAGSSDEQAALGHWRRVRALVDDPEPDAEAAELGVAACSQILALGWRQGAPEEECQRVFEGGRATARRAGQLPLLASLTANYAGIRGLVLGHGGDYVDLSIEAARIADEAGDLALRCGVRGYLAYAYLHAGLCEPGIAACRELEALCGDDVHLGAAVSQFSPLLAARFAGLFQEGYRDAHHQDEGLAATVRLAVEHGYPEQAVWARWSQVQLAHALGAEDDTSARTREALALAEEQGINNQIMARSMQGFALALEGKREEQLAAMRELLQMIREKRVARFMEGLVLRHVADAHLGLGQLNEARGAAAEAVAHMADSQIYGWAIDAFGVLARAQLALVEPESAVTGTLDAYDAAIERTGMRAYERELARLRGRVRGAPPAP
jgi:class 3 adenylate cyclase